GNVTAGGAGGLYGAGPDAAPSGSGTFTVDWRLAYVGSDVSISCAQAGTPTVVLRLEPAGGGATTQIDAACDAMALSTPALPGSYQVTIELRGGGDRVVSSNSGTFEAPGGQITDLGVLVFQIQSFQLAWSLSRGGQATTCQAAGATTVELITRLASEPQVTYSFPCSAGQSSSPAIRLGTYQAAVRLLGAPGAALSATDPMAVTVTDARRAVLPPVVFELR